MGSKSDPNKAAMKQQKEQMKRLDAIDLPELEEYMLQNPELVGLLEAEGIDPTALADIQLDPSLRNNQMEVLEQLKQRSEEGMSAQDKYQMEEMLGQVAGQEKSQRAAVEQQMAERGMDSSGAALMAKLQGGQNSSNNARQQAMQMVAQGQQNRMQALSQLGQQSGNMQNADFARQSQVASAKDAIARANAMNRQNVSATNLSARQGIENQRANIANQQSQVGNQISQQNFNNAISKASGQGNVANAMSNIAGNAPQKPSALQAGLAGAATGSAFGPVGAGIGAGVGLLSSMEDGGVARKGYADGGVPSNDLLPRERRYEESQEYKDHKADETKQHESFKKKYMRRIHKELMGEDKKPEEKEAVKAQDGAMFNADLMAQDAAMLSIGQAPEGTAILGQGNDLTSADIQTNEQAQEAIAPKEGGMDMMKGIGALSKMLGSGEQQKRKPLQLGNFSMQKAENVMTPVGPSNFSNPFEGARFEDGGMPSEYQEIMQRDKKYIDKKIPSPTMYASDGMGDIVDSGMDSFADDRVDAKINDGEAILNVPQQQRFMDLVRGKISVDELGEDDIVEGVPKDYRDSLHDKIENESMGSGDKVDGLKKLLEALGK